MSRIIGIDQKDTIFHRPLNLILKLPGSMMDFVTKKTNEYENEDEEDDFY